MERGRDLSIAFLRSHPVDAARVLEQLSASETSALLGTVPGRIAAPVVARLSQGFAARCLTTLPDEVVVRLMRRLTLPVTASLLRHLPEPRRQLLLSELPASIAVACRVLLRYPEDSLGALADTEVTTVRPGETVREVLARLKAATHDIGDFLYVVDDERRFLFCLRPASLLHANATQPVSSVEQANVPTLPAQASPASVRDHRGWLRFATMPVIESGGRLVGALRQGVLLESGDHSRPDETEHSQHPLAAVVTSAWSLLSAVLQSIVNELPGTVRRKPP